MRKQFTFGRSYERRDGTKQCVWWIGLQEGSGWVNLSYYEHFPPFATLHEARQFSARYAQEHGFPFVELTRKQRKLTAVLRGMQYSEADVN